VGLAHKIGGEQLRRSSADRLLLALAGLVVLGGAVVGGVALDRTMLDDDRSRYSEREHDRLIPGCPDEGLRYSFCAWWVGGIVEAAEGEDLEYVKLAAIVSGLVAEFRSPTGDLRDADVMFEKIARHCDENDVPKTVCEAALLEHA
jgi:hypothetical protein